MNGAGVAVLAVAFAAFSIAVKREVVRNGAASTLNGVSVGKAMPDATLKDTSGAPVTLSALRKDKKVVLVNFWGTWCAPCRIEMPAFEKLYKAQRDSGFLIVAIDEGEPRDSLTRYLAKKPVSFLILIDSAGKFADRLGVQAFPTSILVTSDGRVARVVEGLETYLAMEVEGMLRTKGTAAVAAPGAVVRVTKRPQ